MRKVYDFWQGFMQERVPMSFILVWSGVVLAFCAGVWMTVAVVNAQKRKYHEGMERAEIVRRLQYTLPQKDNGYIRERLQNSLKIEDVEIERRKVCVRLGYARALLGKVKAAPLTIAERMQADEMDGIFTLYRAKECWTVAELRSFNDVCAALLKLSAKYAV
jgi:hypothetical protein